MMTNHRRNNSSAQPGQDKENKRPRLSHEASVGSKDDACQQDDHVTQAEPKRGRGRPPKTDQPLQEVHHHVQSANQANQRGGKPAVLNCHQDCMSAVDHDTMLCEQQRKHEEQLAIKDNKLNELQGSIEEMKALLAVEEAQHAQVVRDLQWKINELQNDSVTEMRQHAEEVSDLKWKLKNKSQDLSAAHALLDTYRASHRDTVAVTEQLSQQCEMAASLQAQLAAARQHAEQLLTSYISLQHKHERDVHELKTAHASHISNMESRLANLQQDQQAYNSDMLIATHEQNMSNLKKQHAHAQEELRCTINELQHQQRQAQQEHEASMAFMSASVQDQDERISDLQSRVACRPATPCPGFDAASMWQDLTPFCHHYPYASHGCQQTHPFSMDTAGLARSHNCAGVAQADGACCQPCAKLRRQLSKMHEKARSETRHQNSCHHANLTHKQMCERNGMHTRAADVARLSTVNMQRTIVSQDCNLRAYQQLVQLIAGKDLYRISMMLRKMLEHRNGPIHMVGMVRMYVEGEHHPRSYTEKEFDLATLVTILGGQSAVTALNRAGILPSATAAKRNSEVRLKIGLSWEGWDDDIATRNLEAQMPEVPPEGAVVATREHAGIGRLSRAFALLLDETACVPYLWHCEKR